MCEPRRGKLTRPTWTPHSDRWAKLKWTAPHRWRTAWNNEVGCHGQYLRFESVQQWTPPYTWSGRIRPIETMIPPIFDSPRPGPDGELTDVCWYTPAIVFHPMYGTERTEGNDHNIVVTVGNQERQTRVGLSAEMRAERPERPYGVRTGYESREFVELPASPWDNKWHTFKFEVLSHAHYRFWWDGVKVLDVVEKEPATMYGSNHIGLRLDFCDVEFDDMIVERS